MSEVSEEPCIAPTGHETIKNQMSECINYNTGSQSGAHGNLLVITGPSGVGKGTIVSRLISEVPKIQRSVSVTTRQKRPGEEEGVDYFFRSKKEFKELQAAGNFLEWAEFAGNLYATPKQWVDEQLSAGIDIILEIEVQGAKQIKEAIASSVLIFLSPPSLAELESRLRKRGTESEEVLTLRLRKAELELKERTLFHYEVVNDVVERALNDLVHIVYSERCRVRLND
jgi:guanylate kinase